MESVSGNRTLNSEREFNDLLNTARRGDHIEWNEQLIQHLQKKRGKLAEQTELCWAVKQIPLNEFANLLRNHAEQIFAANLFLLAQKVFPTWQDLETILLDSNAAKNGITLIELAVFTRNVNPLPTLRDIAPYLQSHDERVDSRLKLILASNCQLITAEEYARNEFNLEKKYLDAAFYGHSVAPEDQRPENESKTMVAVKEIMHNQPTARFYDTLNEMVLNIFSRMNGEHKTHTPNTERQHALLEAQNRARINPKRLAREGANVGAPVLTIYMRFTQMHHPEIADLLAVAAQQWILQGGSRYFTHLELVGRFSETKAHPEMLHHDPGHPISFTRVQGKDFAENYEKGAVMVHVLPATRGTSVFPVLSNRHAKGFQEKDIEFDVDLESQDLLRTINMTPDELVIHFIRKLNELEDALDTTLAQTTS